MLCVSFPVNVFVDRTSCSSWRLSQSCCVFNCMLCTFRGRMRSTRSCSMRKCQKCRLSKTMIPPIPTCRLVSPRVQFYRVPFQRTSGRVAIEIARLKPGPSSRPSSMSSVQLQPGSDSMSSMDNVMPPPGFGKGHGDTAEIRNWRHIRVGRGSLPWPCNSVKVELNSPSSATTV